MGEVTGRTTWLDIGRIDPIPLTLRIATDEHAYGDLSITAGDEATTRKPNDPSLWVTRGHSPRFGSNVMIADATLDVLPIHAHAGAIIPKFPDDVMTQGPPEESGNASVKSLDDRRRFRGPTDLTLSETLSKKLP